MVSNGRTLILNVVETGESFLGMEEDMCTHKVHNYLISLYFSSGK